MYISLSNLFFEVHGHFFFFFFFFFKFWISSHTCGPVLVRMCAFMQLQYNNKNETRSLDFYRMPIIASIRHCHCMSIFQVVELKEINHSWYFIYLYIQVVRIVMMVCIRILKTVQNLSSVPMEKLSVRNVLLGYISTLNWKSVTGHTT